MDISAVRIVLVAPAGPLNVGSVARVMKNFGLTQLVLVDPQCDPLSAEALQMAVHAKDVLQSAWQVKTIPEALDGCCFAIATTARQRGFNAPLERPDAVLPALALQAQPNSDTALIFGPEDRGLSNEELAYAQRFIKIPTDAAYSALNLAQAVAVCCYELSRTTQALPREELTETAAFISKETQSKTLRASPLSVTPTKSVSQMSGTQISVSEGVAVAQLNELEGYYQHLEHMLLKVEYLYSHTAASRMRKFRQLLNRANPTSQEVAMLRGILRQTEWALSNRSSPVPSRPVPSRPEQTDSSQD
ncbi:MAG: RNA methyltransferase [Cyanobacteria bacterium P01_D01_bin.105]